MKIFQKFKVIQKIMISIVIVILMNFAMPIRSEAGLAHWTGNTIGQPLIQFLAMVGDVGIGVLHKFVLNNEYDITDSVMLDPGNPTVQNGDLNASNETDKTFLVVGKDLPELDASLLSKGIIKDNYEIPNIMVCPEYIFSNRIGMLDINFINPNSYGNQDSNKQATSSSLQSTIASWYLAFRNLAIIAMLTILVYIGIRILLSSTAPDKAKYKERILDWLVRIVFNFCNAFYYGWNPYGNRRNNQYARRISRILLY